MTVGVAPKDYVAVIAAACRLPAEVTYGTSSKTFGKYELFREAKVQEVKTTVR